MKVIDFDSYFRQFIEDWIAENASAAKNYEELEAKLPEVQLRFLNAPADWLGGEKPGMYFGKFSDAEALAALIVQYEDEDISVPDTLIERVVELGDTAPLMRRAADEGLPGHVRITMLNALIEIGSSDPKALCIRLVAERMDDDPLSDVAAELLKNIGHEAVPDMLEELEDASDDALLTFLDILCNFPGDERIYTYTARQFENRPDQRMYYASYLQRLNDPRALPLLYAALEEDDLAYLDYIEIRNAIEALGGEVDTQREFSGDPYYESLKQIT